ncbi:unnamed protein product [Kuraishia capsulata CBS 1993]|uniref:Uncharacterized protein n=1 Tax=Kuraishia capsulata CBS 1993 TaxID=1382522 RepID=W6MTR1_9ASCO|nr:uncharacterized protein KUCA_T00004601001 [Kuraishia capsulata CBS 1993]CDK28617.1 unnamed protein product [Kuraishia capsulata CBS 1993]
MVTGMVTGIVSAVQMIDCGLIGIITKFNLRKKKQNSNPKQQIVSRLDLMRREQENSQPSESHLRSGIQTFNTVESSASVHTHDESADYKVIKDTNWIVQPI